MRCAPQTPAQNASDRAQSAVPKGWCCTTAQGVPAAAEGGGLDAAVPAVHNKPMRKMRHGLRGIEVCCQVAPGTCRGFVGHSGTCAWHLGRHKRWGA